jgi:hypothetical protein
MPAIIADITCWLECTTSTGTLLRYTYTRLAGVVTVIRKLTPPPGGGNTASTSIEGVRNDSRQLLKIAEHFDSLEHLS